MNTEKKQMKSLSRDEMKNVMGGKNEGSLCVVNGMPIYYNVPAGPAAISCGQTYGSSCQVCYNTSY